MADGEQYPFFVVANIDECIQPIDRGERYEDPLTAVLQERGLGEITGGGSQLDENFMIESVDIDMSLLNLEEALNLVKSTLVKLGAPIGSTVSYERDGERIREPIGDNECLGIYLDGVGLPDEVYAELDFDQFYEKLGSDLKAVGELRNIRQADEETGLFVFGPSADAIFAALQAIPDRAPILQNARIAFKRKDAEKSPTEIRLPRFG